MISRIFIDIAVACGISTFLALVLVIAQRYLADYGICKVTINKKKEVSVQGGISLLGALSDQQIFLPSACGGRGSCGTCKCQLTSGGGPVLPTEKPFLSAKELGDGIRLSCQVKVKGDIEIQIEESIFNIRRYRTKVIDIVDYTYDIKGITFQLIDPQRIDFKAGQYVQLESQPYGKVKQKAVRAYSISSKPQDNGLIQLIIRLVPEGICTTWVHNHLKVGDEVFLTGPYGDFYIRDTEADMIFVAGGSGKAPIKSMLEYLQVVGTKRKMTYFFGARTCKDLYLTDEMKAFEKVFPDFKYEPVVSQPCPEEGWEGKLGYIMPYFPEAIRDPKNTEAYLCGSPGMLAAVQKALVELGVPQAKIYFDSFG
ncbi:MAG: FAD-binding oxidoreductase [Candidatus Cloacimonetes bacterium]|nr:FAD-binding oxidoreductase [Candidatus Cloacimonadota bacterium]